MSSSPSDFSRIENVVSALADAGAKKQRGKDPIAPAQSAGAAIGSSTGEGRASSGTNEAGAVASPLKETDVGRRVYYPDQDEYDADGNPFIVNHIKRLYLQDANGNPFVIDGFGLPDPNNITIEA